MATVTPKPELIRLSHTGVGQVLVCDERDDRFVLTVQEAAAACANANEQVVWSEEFRQVLSRVYSWCEKNSSQISRCVAGLVEQKFVYLVVPSSRMFDMKLSDSIAGLELELVEEFKRCRVEVRQFPGFNDDRLAQVLDIEKSIQVWPQKPSI